jgi:hypothetical protein
LTRTLDKKAVLYTIGTTMRKRRTVIYLEKKESESLKRVADRTGAAITEIARRAIAEYLRRHKAK